jgi:hypothetical protein
VLAVLAAIPSLAFGAYAYSLRRSEHSELAGLDATAAWDAARRAPHDQQRQACLAAQAKVDELLRTGVIGMSDARPPRECSKFVR